MFEPEKDYESYTERYEQDEDLFSYRLYKNTRNVMTDDDSKNKVFVHKSELEVYKSLMHNNYENTYTKVDFILEL